MLSPHDNSEKKCRDLSVCIGASLLHRIFAAASHSKVKFFLRGNNIQHKRIYTRHELRSAGVLTLMLLPACELRRLRSPTGIFLQQIFRNC
jgi:hypothetical protein